MTVRFVDQGWGLSQFADQVLVRCPHCQSRGTVHAHWQPYTWTAHFECSGCGLALARGLQQSWDDLSVWQGPVLLRGRRPKLALRLETAPHGMSAAIFCSGCCER